jgi:hypothetical protein
MRNISVDSIHESDKILYGITVLSRLFPHGTNYQLKAGTTDKITKSGGEMPYRSQGGEAVNRAFYAMSAEDQEAIFRIMADRARANLAHRPVLRLVADNSSTRRNFALRDVAGGG